MDWSKWIPRERANLCFIFREGQVLLIRKKRGLGAGKINAPGGKIEAGETAYASAQREAQEEVGLLPLQIQKGGELFFQFLDGYSLHCTVFRAEGCEGTARETEEALPIWTPVEAIPYQEMWADDAHWLPLLIEGRRFKGYFVFDNERMLSGQVDEVQGFEDDGGTGLQTMG